MPIWDGTHGYDTATLQSFRGCINPVGRDFPARALERSRQIELIERTFTAACSAQRVRALKQAFTRWIVDQDHGGADPLIPSQPDFSQLEKELANAGCTRAQFQVISGAMAGQCARSLEAIGLVPPENVGAQPACTRSESTNTIALAFMGSSLSVNSSHYEKLRALYLRCGGDYRALDEAIFCLLSRYGILNDVGFQAALHEGVFDTLRSEFGVMMECFASPLNCRYGSYCSAFVDTDAPFGSVGSFFDFFPTVGSFEVNPPFTEPLMLRAARHIDDVLSKSADLEPLSFCVFVPCWVGSDGWETMRSSSYLRRLMVIRQDCHGYVVGNQHAASRRHLPATFHTGVFFLQNDKALQCWGPTVERVRRLGLAFEQSLPPLSPQDIARRDRIMREKKQRDIQNGWADAGKDDTGAAGIEEYVCPALRD